LGGVQPIGTLQTNVTIEGYTWELWIGMNGSMKVFSFVAPSPVNDFNADIKQFYNYLAKTQNYPASKQYLLSMYIYVGYL
jgi:xyloglucan-specific endo-beta-1,4-glucanase